MSGRWKACENTDNATHFDHNTEDQHVSTVSLRQRSVSAQILFTLLPARGVCLPVLDPSQRMSGRAKPPITKITVMAGLEGFLVERCKVPVYSLSVQCVGDSTDMWTVLPFHRYIIRDAPAISFSLHPLQFLPNLFDRSF